LRKRLSPEKISQFVLKEKLTKEAAADLLISLIEASEAFNIRAKCINVIKILRIKSNRIFLILENCLVSDENSLVRCASILTLINTFPEKSLLPLRWAIEHDNSVNVLKIVYDIIEKKKDPIMEFLKLRLIKRLKQIYKVNAEVLLFLNLEVIYSEFIGNPNLLIKKSWYKVMRMINLYPDYIGLNSRLFYLIGGGVNLTPLPDSINNLKFLRSLFLKDYHEKESSKFFERIKISQQI
jgi:hypothetical protein